MQSASDSVAASSDSAPLNVHTESSGRFEWFSLFPGNSSTECAGASYLDFDYRLLSRMAQRRESRSSVASATYRSGTHEPDSNYRYLYVMKSLWGKMPGHSFAQNLAWIFTSALYCSSPMLTPAVSCSQRQSRSSGSAAARPCLLSAVSSSSNPTRSGCRASPQSFAWTVQKLIVAYPVSGCQVQPTAGSESEAFQYPWAACTSTAAIRARTLASPAISVSPALRTASCLSAAFAATVADWI